MLQKGVSKSMIDDILSFQKFNLPRPRNTLKTYDERPFRLDFLYFFSFSPRNKAEVVNLKFTFQHGYLLLMNLLTNDEIPFTIF